MSVRCVIVVDEPLAVELIGSYCAQVPQLNVVATCGSAIEASRVLRLQQVDLLLLHIKMPQLMGESPNAIKMQVYCVLIAQLLMVVIRKKAATKKSFANMITVIRLHLTSYVGLLDFIKDTYKAWRKTDKASFAFSP